MLYQIASGRTPFRGANAIAVLKRVVDEAPRPIRQIIPETPEWLCAIIERLHAKNPDERYQSAKEVADLLARCQNELQIHGTVTCVATPSQAARASSSQSRSAETAPEAASPEVERPSDKPASRWPLIFTAAASLCLVGFMLFEWTGVSSFFRQPAGQDQPVASGDTQPESPVATAQTKGATDQVANAPSLAMAPFDAAAAKKHQEAWAQHLGVPVEFTNSIGMRFRLIPPGEFTMGMTKEEAETLAALYPNDGHWKAMYLSSAPTHKVRITQAFYLGTYEVTQEQYEKIAGVNPSHFSATGKGKGLVQDEDPRQLPVERVSFIDAAEFCSKLSKQEQLKPAYFSANNMITLLAGEGYRLPTEAEWEWACRAGANTSWFHSEQESELEKVAWFVGNSGSRTHAVGQLKANPFGLYDVHGNVWAWCQDWHDAQAYSKRGPGPTENPQGSDTGASRVIRGGDWSQASTASRAAFRNVGDLESRFHNLGFRVLLPVDAARPTLKATGSAISPATAFAKPASNRSPATIQASVPPNAISAVCP